MKPRVLDIFKRSGDAHLGQTLTRLASLAAATHRYDVARQMANASTRDAKHQPEPVDLDRVAHQARTDVGPIRKEADR